jgi:mono/diheme cytochrome c family protein
MGDFDRIIKRKEVYMELCDGLSKRLQVWLVAIVAIVMVVAFLPVQANAAEVAGSGNYKAGENIFTGRTRLTNGGPPCISCHTAGAKLGALAGGALGPNLTKVWETKFFLVDPNWINSSGSPVMGPIFTNRNILPEEVEHLKAFFSVVAQENATIASTKKGPFAVGGIIGTIVMLVIFSIVWGGRFRSRNGGTVHEDLWRNYGGKGGKR